ncbi:MAG: hypothetical protein EOM28_11055 [Clostridia bacterium]|nr:hypothetical protein [Clostridia bacterium]
MGCSYCNNCSVIYEQVLLTTGENAYYKMNYGYVIPLNTYFAMGKCGYGGKHLGGCLNRKIGTKQIEIVNHLYF